MQRAIVVGASSGIGYALACQLSARGWAVAGFVDTAMAKGPGKFWVASPEKAAAQILQAVDRKVAVEYVTRRWRLIAWLLRLLPESVHRRL